MDKIASILISLLIAFLVYLLFAVAVRDERAKGYIRRHWGLHPNAICIWRVLIGLLGTLLYFMANQYFFGILFFTVSAVLDGVDGLVARKCDLITPSGEEIDPLCDKITYLPPIAFFVYLGPLSVVTMWVLVIVEFCGQFLVRYIIKRFTKLSVEANNFGKTKAVLCYALIIYFAVLDGDLQLPDFTSQILQLCIVLSIASSVFKIIPNRLYADILSTLNLISGITGILLTWRGRYVLAAIAVLAGQFFDVLDGRMAEKHGGTKFGPWLDDIADLVSFGLCPGLLIFVQGNLKLPSLFVAMLYSFAVGFRLWRFVARDKHNKSLLPNVFNGLPSPAGALVALGACLFWQDLWISGIVIIVTSWLLVSHIRFIHFRSVIGQVPRNLVVMFGFIVVFVIGYLIKARNPKMLGAALLITFLLYALGGNSKLLGKRIIRSR